MVLCKKNPFHITNTGISGQHLKTLIEVVFGLLFIISFSCFVLLSIPIYLFRFCVVIYAKCFPMDLDEIFNGLSSYLVNDYFNKIPRANIAVQIIIRGNVTLEELKHLVKTRWIETNDDRFKNFSHYPVRWMGFTFYKKDAAINVDNHVYLCSNVEKGFFSEDHVTVFSEKLLNSPIAPFKSPWEVHLIQNYKNYKISHGSEQLSVLVFRFHHSLTDGFGVMAAFVQAFSNQKLADLKIPKPKYLKRTWWEKLTRWFLLSIKLIIESGRFVLQAFISSPWKVPDEKKHWYQNCFRSEMIPIQKLIEIRNKFGKSFSSIMYSAVSAGIQKSLYDSNQTTDINTKYLKDSSMYCLHAIPLPGHPMSLTNHLTLTFLDLPTCNYDNSIDRLYDVNIILKSARETSCLPWILPWIAYLIGCHVYPVLQFLLKNKMVPVGISNFPLDPINLEINGKQAIAADFVAGALNGETGVGVMLMSYGQYIRVSATAEKALMRRHDLNRLGKYMVDEIENLFLIACSQKE